jgi:hypothetical protein
LGALRGERSTQTGHHMGNLPRRHWASVRVSPRTSGSGQGLVRVTDLRRHVWPSTLPPSDLRACSLSSGRRSSPLLLTLPLQMDPPHNLPNSCHRDSNRFLPNRNCNRTLLSKINSHGLSAHGLRMLSNPDRRHHHFPDIIMRFPRLRLPPANCSSLEVMYTTLRVMMYM